MVLEKLGEGLRKTLQKIANAVFVDDTLLLELVKDIQRSLLAADVNVKLVLSLTEHIKERAKKEDLPPGLTKREQLVQIVYDELATFLGGERAELSSTEPLVIMLVGLFGSGKTTTAGKLAKYFQKRGKHVVLVGLDVHRPAAMEQLRQVGLATNVPVLIEESTNALASWKKHEEKTKEFDVVIIDTAGRDAISSDLISELKDISKASNPNETLLVISADVGQTAETQAKSLNKAANITGVIVTKMDGTAKGGGALSACAATGAAIKFIGVGEKQDDLDSFNPKGFVGRLLGMGDIEALLEKAKEAYSEEDAKDVEEKFLKGEFNLLDLYNQMEAMNKMGSLGKLVEMIPGFGQLQLPKEALQVQEGKLVKWRFAMDSMTQQELEDPEVLDAKRIERISKGSGVGQQELRELLKQYRQSKKLVKMMKGGDPEQLMKKLQKGQGFRMR